MEGVTILEEQIIYSPHLLTSCFLISGIIGLIIGIIMLTCFDEELSLIFLGIGISSLLLGLVMGTVLHGAPTNKATYIVRIEEKIDLNEFLNNYEIIEHEKYSNIYKIKGKKIMLEE